MATDWFYKSGDEPQGPFSSNQLRDLVKAGTITRTTLVRKNGMPDWKPAGQIEKLFVEKAATPPSADGSSLMEKAKAATKAAALATEKTKLSTVTLPAAYAALGKDCYQGKRWQSDFPDIYKELAELSRQLQESKRKATETVSGTGLADKAKSVASKGVEFAKGQQLSLQITSVLANLGKSAFDKYSLQAGPEPLTSDVGKHLSRLKELDQQVGQQVAKAGGKKWLMRGAALIGALMVFSWIAGPSGNETDPGDAESTPAVSTSEERPASPSPVGGVPSKGKFTKEERWPNGKLKSTESFKG